ncbi:phosphate ABC transporter substrate-binding protein [candidate division KSB1 bacterium]|nr:phosphate ABC transporter substrate-binding protein [candidate division KSB1 bacterium]
MQKIILIILAVLNFGCSSVSLQKSTRLRIKGSDTMLPLVRFWAEVYMIENPTVSIYVEGGGTATGMQALARGDIDICMASRTILPKEAQQIVNRFGTVGVATRVAKDALSIYVHPGNPVKNLTIEQVRDIYSGAIRSWASVGGDDAPIQLLNRLPTSGTFAYFQEHVLEGGAYSTSGTALPTTKALIETIARNEDAIGYGGMAFETDVYHCDINGVEPSRENVLNDSYPLSRYLYLYTVDNPQGKTRDFINWVLSEHGQDIVKWVGYFPIWQNESLP